MADKKAEYRKPASQLDLEARQERGNASDRVLSTADTYEAPAGEGDGRDFRVEGNKTDNYVGTSPEYMTYANKTEAPVEAKDSAESKVFELFNEQLNTEPVKPASKEAESDSEDEEEEEPKGSTSSPDPSK
jgi:hypothetical protein